MCSYCLIITLTTSNNYNIELFVSDKDPKKPALKKVQQVCSIPFRSTLFPSYFHSFGMTENYIVFVEQPFKLDIIKLATAYFRGVSWGSCLKFCKDDIVSCSKDSKRKIQEV